MRLLQHWLHVEMRYSPGSDYTNLLHKLQAVDRSLIPSDRSAPGAGIQAFCGIQGCLAHRLGSHVQRQCQGYGQVPNYVGMSIASSSWQYALPCATSDGAFEAGTSGLVCTDNMATVAYINRQCSLHSRRMSQLACHLLLFSQKHLRSLRVIHIPGVFNQAADKLSRAALPGEWRLHPQTVQLIWSQFRVAQVDPLASPETAHCQ